MRGLSRRGKESGAEGCRVERRDAMVGGVVCLFVLRLNVPVNNSSVMSGRSHRFLGN